MSHVAAFETCDDYRDSSRCNESATRAFVHAIQISFGGQTARATLTAFERPPIITESEEVFPST